MTSERFEETEWHRRTPLIKEEADATQSGGCLYRKSPRKTPWGREYPKSRLLVFGGRNSNGLGFALLCSRFRHIRAMPGLEKQNRCPFAGCSNRYYFPRTSCPCPREHCDGKWVQLIPPARSIGHRAVVPFRHDPAKTPPSPSIGFGRTAEPQPISFTEKAGRTDRRTGRCNTPL